jgi:hypothetical protein
LRRFAPALRSAATVVVVVVVVVVSVLSAPRFAAWPVVLASIPDSSTRVASSAHRSGQKASGYGCSNVADAPLAGG